MTFKKDLLKPRSWMHIKLDLIYKTLNFASNIKITLLLLKLLAKIRSFLLALLKKIRHYSTNNSIGKKLKIISMFLLFWKILKLFFSIRV